jgi:hypothetical protein
METEEEGPVESVLFKKDLTYAEKNFRRILRDPLAVHIARTNYCKDFFNLDPKYKAILNDDKKLKRYLDEDEVFKREILCPSNDFWRDISGIHIRLAKERAMAWETAYKKELDKIAKTGRYGKKDSRQNNIESPRTERRVRVEKTNREHPHIEEMKKSGNKWGYMWYQYLHQQRCYTPVKDKMYFGFALFICLCHRLSTF